MNKFEYKKLTPFKWFVLENFPFIEADFDALTDWQLFCKLGKEINKIINSQNVVGEQMEEVTNNMISLQEFVENYFDNLDIQEEVNTKLNEMAESGELAEIISQYLELSGIFSYNNLEEMLSATNLINNSRTIIFGKEDFTDGGYKEFVIKDNTHNSSGQYSEAVLTYGEEFTNAESSNLWKGRYRKINGDFQPGSGFCVHGQEGYPDRL